MPAALNNIVGLKPTLGSLSASGSVPACRSVETISVFGLTVADAYRAYRVAAIFDPADSYAKRVETRALGQPPSGLRIGVPDAATLKTFGDTVQEDSFHASLALLEDAGHRIVQMDFSPFYDVAEMLYEGAWVAERHSVIEELLERDPEAVLPVTRQIICKAEQLSATDAFRGFYRLKDLARKVEGPLSDIDILCVPTIPTFYTVTDLERDPVGPNSNLGTYTNFVNLLDMCGLAVPVPPRTDGRPGSVTLLGAAGEDARLAEVALALESAGTRSLGATGWPFA